MADAPQKTTLRNATQMFNEAWTYLEEKYGRENMRFPAEIMWLGGAPGAGKGTNTSFILQERSMTAPPIVMSSLLNSPEAEALKAKGLLVGDGEVVRILLEHLLKPEYESGVVVDGFPRTMMQVECVRMLYQRIQDLRSEYFNTPLASKFHRPVFRITVLYVTEDVAVDRQLKRGQEIKAHNERVKQTGKGKELELRPTDLDEDLARERFRIFMKQTFEALQSLRASFHYHFIDANGALDQVKQKIANEFQYQSSLELAGETYDSIRGIPICTSLTLHARQELVERLDNYRERHPDLFSQVVSLIEDKIVPSIRRHNAVGRARVRLADIVLEQDMAVDMVIDILTERGFFPTADRIEHDVPIRFDPQTNAIVNALHRVWLFDINFPTSHIRRGGH